MKKIKKVLIYISLFLLSYLVISALWQMLVYDKMYHCSDPVFILNLIPPFVHGSDTGDYYITNKNILYLIWIIFIFIFLSLPYFMKNVYKNLKNK